jgi:hypothetical protein
MAGGVVVKVDESPYGDKNPAKRCVYEAVEHEMWGVGVGENNAPHQKVTNAAFRLFMEGKGMALLGTSSVDRSKFLPTEDFRKFPGKVYQMKPGLTPDERKEAIVQHVEPDITGGWMDVIRMSEQFSDDDTGITKYTQGDDSSNLNKTASGISMIMSASSLPIKEVIQNIDEMWIEPVIECLIDWDLKYLEPETVQKIHGDEAAQLWAQIKQLRQVVLHGLAGHGHEFLHAEGSPDQQDPRVLPSSPWATRSPHRWSMRANCCSRRGT